MKKVTKNLVLLMSLCLSATALFAVSISSEPINLDKFEDQFNAQLQNGSRTISLKRSSAWYPQLKQRIEIHFKGQMPTNQEAMLIMANKKKISGSFAQNAKNYCVKHAGNDSLHTQCLIKAEELIEQYKNMQNLIQKNKNFMDFQLQIEPSLLDLANTQVVYTYSTADTTNPKPKLLAQTLAKVFSTTDLTTQKNIIVPEHYGLNARTGSPYIMFEAAANSAKQAHKNSIKEPTHVVIAFDLNNLLIRVFTQNK